MAQEEAMNAPLTEWNVDEGNNITETATILGDMSEDGVWGGMEYARSLFSEQQMTEVVEEGLRKGQPHHLFDCLWFEGETAILFADNGAGKSILAVQIAESIASGVPIPGFKMDAEAQKVLYFDFELSERQLSMRYSDESGNAHRFHPNLLRMGFQPSATSPEKSVVMEESGLDDGEITLMGIEAIIRDHNAKVVIIDNLSALCQESEEAAKALEFMKALKRIKSQYSLSLLIIAHTPKIEPFMPITKNDLGGSKQISNFVDSIFALGRAKKPSTHRYIIQLKSRDSAEVYNHENIIVCNLNKTGSFLGLEFVDYGVEMSTLKGAIALSKEQQESLAKNIEKKVDKKHPYTYTELLNELIARDTTSGNEAQKRARATQRLIRSKYKVKDGDKYYIDPKRFFK